MIIQFKFKICDGYLLFLISFHQFTMVSFKWHQFNWRHFLDISNWRTIIIFKGDRKIGSICSPHDQVKLLHFKTENSWLEIRFLVKYFPSPWDYPRYNTHNVLTVQWYKKLMKFLFMEHTKKVLEKNEWFLESPNNALFAVNSVCFWWGPENLVCCKKIKILFCLSCLTFNSQLLDWRLPK